MYHHAKQVEHALKESEDKFKTLASELSALNTDKDRFISILAHDLKSPFNALLGLTELLSKNVRRYDIGKNRKFRESYQQISTKHL